MTVTRSKNLDLQDSPPDGTAPVLLLSEIALDAAARTEGQRSEARCLVCEGRLWRRFLAVNGCWYSRCWRCGSLMWNPRWSEDEATRFYNSRYYELTLCFQALGAETTRGIPLPTHLTGEALDWAMATAARVPLPSAIQVLDVGCGAGGLLHELRERYGIRGKGIEVSRHYESRWSRYDIDATAESLDDHLATGARYDLVFCSEVVEHVANPREFVARLMRALDSDGSLVLTTPNLGRYAPLLVGNIAGLISPPGHINLITTKGLVLLARMHGAAAAVRTFGNPVFSIEAWARSFDFLADHCPSLYEFTGNTFLMPRSIARLGARARKDYVVRKVLPCAASGKSAEMLREEVKAHASFRGRLVRKMAATPVVGSVMDTLEDLMGRSEGFSQMVGVFTSGGSALSS